MGWVKTGGGACLYKREILQSLERDDININAGRLLRIDDSVVRNIFFILLFLLYEKYEASEVEM